MTLLELIRELNKVREKHGDVTFFDVFRTDFGDELVLEEHEGRKRIYIPFDLEEEVIPD